MNIHGWGRYPIVDAEMLLPVSKSHCRDLMNDNLILIPRGLGRSYGDSANSGRVLQSSQLNHYINFDEALGVLTCEAGVSIQEILELIVPKGWFLYVTPGTTHVTIGGAIASDVHGKNHHISGTFTDHIVAFELMLGSGEVVTVSRELMPDLFRATCGGMGLTGFILSAVIQLKSIHSSLIIQTTMKAACLEEVCELFEMNALAEYSVAWIDSLAKGRHLGRSLLMLGAHAPNGCLGFSNSNFLNLSFDMPQALLNTHSIKAFNFLYYHKRIMKKSVETMSLSSYFYPLDVIGNWNRIYGNSGFIQYQFVLPKSAGVKGLKELLSKIVESGRGSFLTVLKVFGPSNENYLSFPIKGYTLALDFRVCEETRLLINELDGMLVNMGGRVYLTKDAFMTELTFKSTYPNWEIFEMTRAKYGAIGKFSSNQSNRLGLQ